VAAGPPAVEDAESSENDRLLVDDRGKADQIDSTPALMDLY
jgi:hypothetical protein